MSRFIPGIDKLWKTPSTNNDISSIIIWPSEDIVEEFYFKCLWATETIQKHLYGYWTVVTHHVYRQEWDLCAAITAQSDSNPRPLLLKRLRNHPPCHEPRFEVSLIFSYYKIAHLKQFFLSWHIKMRKQL